MPDDPVEAYPAQVAAALLRLSEAVAALAIDPNSFGAKLARHKLRAFYEQLGLKCPDFDMWPPSER